MLEDIPLTAPTHPQDPYDVIYEGSEHQATPQFLGAAMRDYRPVSGLSNYTDTSSLKSRIIDDTYDPSAPFMPDPGEDPSSTQSRTGLTTNATSKEYDPNGFDDQINSSDGSLIGFC
ncbi:hypothetical protein Pst134EB_026269 [Puccinia striiformis f. sp. tritici]|uniref:Uncharacterized protein n=1 Tax=Puccinia striiformis f. sp. tritici PST-78 TaxID=1165861 RepID=A0A0L0UQ37_9BASI|nr:hypothetical protein Pst134EB_026269 [Puccinia striiformis f. sp. tritici]KNE88899.1 hypothetical protein PSTG_17655 [Puccinia striiformis f. sp. tritici PST-78]